MDSRDYSFWEREAGIRRRPLPVEAAPKTTDIAIVGAGFAGSWLAYFLKREIPNINITILERDFFNLGASVRNAGFLSCGGVSEWMEDAEGLEWAEVERTLLARIRGIEIIREEFPEYDENACGSVDFDPLTPDKRQFLERLNQTLEAHGYPPFYSIRDFPLGETTQTASFNFFDSEVNPARLLLGLHARLRKVGVKFLWQTTINKFGKGEATWDGGRIRYEQGFLCTNGFAKHLNSNSIVQPARGQILVTAPCTTRTLQTLAYFKSGYDYFRFIGNRLLVGGGRMAHQANENTDNLETSEELRNYLREFASRVLGHEKFQIEHHWAGIMGLRSGRHASITDILRPVKIDDQTEEIAGFGGWGVTLTPYVASQRAAIWSRENNV